MILCGTPSRSLSRWDVLAVCGLGVLLLPLLATRAGPSALPDAADETPAELAPGLEMGQSVPELPALTRASTDRAEQIAQLRDELELLQIQLSAKKAEREMAVVHLRGAEARSTRLGQQALSGIAPQGELEKARVEMEVSRAQVSIRDAAVREAEVRLKQATRRLEALGGQDPAAPARTAAALFKTRVHDFGDVSGQQRVGWSVQLVNSTKETYRLSGVRVADPAISASPRSVELLPGDQGTIAIWIDPSRFSGPKLFQVWVHFSQPREEQVRIDMKATSGSAKPAAPRPTEEDRLRGLEQKLQQLLHEVDGLRKEMRPRKSADRPVRAIGPEVVMLTKRDFLIPFRNDRAEVDGARITQLTLWRTRDDGRTWEAVEKVLPGAGKFELRGLEDGLHGFSVTATKETGTGDPAPRPGDVPALRIRVNADG